MTTLDHTVDGRAVHHRRRGQRPVPRRRAGLVGALTVLVLGVGTACGGTAETSSEASAGGGSTPELLAEAHRINTEAQVRPTEIQVTEPIGKPIPTGKTIAAILCGLPSCDEAATIFTEAAAVLGWDVVKIATTGAPESVKAGWAQAVEMAPDAVISSGAEVYLIKDELAQLVAAGIPVVQNSLTEQATPENGLLASFNSSATTRAGGLAAAFIVDDSQGTANTLYVDLPAIAVLASVKANFEETYERLCPGCGYESMEVAVTQIGKEIPNLIVSKLRANPDITTVQLPLGSMTTGLPAALKAAGIADRVDLVTTASSATNLAAVAAGDEAAAAQIGLYELMWLEADTLARHFAGVEVGDLNELPMIRQTFVKDNVVNTTGNYPLVEDYQQQYLALWGKS